MPDRRRRISQLRYLPPALLPAFGVYTLRQRISRWKFESGTMATICLMAEIFFGAKKMNANEETENELSPFSCAWLSKFATVLAVQRSRQTLFLFSRPFQFCRTAFDCLIFKFCSLFLILIFINQKAFFKLFDHCSDRWSETQSARFFSRK